MRILYILYTIVSVLFICSCTNGNSTDASSASEEDSKNTSTENLKTAVKLDTAKRVPFSFLVNTTGKIVSPKNVLLKAQQQSNVLAVRAKRGQFVKAGQTLVQLDNKTLLIEKEKAELALEKAELEFDNTLIGYPGILSKGGAVKDSLLAKLRLSSGIQEAEIRLKEVDIELSKCITVAPFSGVVYDIKAAKGQYVNVGDELLSMYQKSPVWLTVNVLQTEAVRLKRGVGVAVSLSALPAENEMSGIIDYINPKASESGMVEVGVLINNPLQEAWIGMNAETQIKIPQGERLVVPKEAVVLRSGKEVVFTFVNGLAKWNYVKTGLDNGEVVEILEGLEENSPVITNNNLQLAHDAPVTVSSSAP